MGQEDIIEPLGGKLKLKLRKALFTSVRWKRDECGDWTLFGKKGKIYIDNNNFYVFLKIQRNTKQSLEFMKVHQEGDNEIVFSLDRLPNSKEATRLRKLVGLRSSRVLSPEHRAKLLEYSRKFSFKNASNRPETVQGFVKTVR